MVESSCRPDELLLRLRTCSLTTVTERGRSCRRQTDGSPTRRHKLLFVYARDLKPFRRILRRFGVARVDDLRLIAESAHLHHSEPRYEDEFQQLAARLGAADSTRPQRRE